MVDAPRARRLAKRISQIVAHALEHEVEPGILLPGRVVEELVLAAGRARVVRSGDRPRVVEGARLVEAERGIPDDDDAAAAG